MRTSLQSLESGSSDGSVGDDSADDGDSGESDDDEWDPSLATPAVCNRRRVRSGSRRRSRPSVRNANHRHTDVSEGTVPDGGFCLTRYCLAHWLISD